MRCKMSALIVNTLCQRRPASSAACLMCQELQSQECMRTLCQVPERFLSLAAGKDGPGQRLHLSRSNALLQQRMQLGHLRASGRVTSVCGT